MPLKCLVEKLLQMKCILINFTSLYVIGHCVFKHGAKILCKGLEGGIVRRIDSVKYHIHRNWVCNHFVVIRIRVAIW